MTTRICRVCQQRFLPALQDQSSCNECGRASREVAIVDRYMLRAPGESVARISIATGITEDVIRQLATDGALAATPVDDTPPTQCTCPPGESGRCPACRNRLARQFGAAHWAAMSPEERQSGMRARHRNA